MSDAFVWGFIGGIAGFFIVWAIFIVAICLTESWRIRSIKPKKNLHRDSFYQSSSVTDRTQEKGRRGDE